MSNFVAVEFTEDMIDSVYDNGGETFDRYLINVIDVHGHRYNICSGESGNFPNGVFMCDSGHIEQEPEREIAFSALPEKVQQDVINFCIE